MRSPEGDVPRTSPPLWRWAGVYLVATGGLVLLAAIGSALNGGWGGMPLALGASVCLCLAAMTTLIESLRASGAVLGLGSVVLSFIAYLGIYQSGSQLLSGARTSVLSRIGYISSTVQSDVPRAASVFVAAIGAFAVAEGCVSLVRYGRSMKPSTVDYRQVYVALLIVGTVTSLAFGGKVNADQLALRGQVSGRGMLLVLQQGLPLAIAIGILCRHWNSRAMGILSVCGLALYSFFAESRSMLLCIGLAVVIRILKARMVKRVSAGAVLALAALTYVASIFVVAFAQYRSALLRTGTGTFLQQVWGTLPFPWTQLSSKGSLDTLDGLVLSLHVDRAWVGASPLDPLKAVVELVPSQVWHNKPDYLSPRITHLYTDFGGNAGIFLSGPGYLHIIFGGLIGVVAGSMFLGFTYGALSRRLSGAPVPALLVTYGIARFFVGGDAYDIQYTIVLFLTLLVGIGLARSWTWAKGGEARPPTRGIDRSRVVHGPLGGAAESVVAASRTTPKEG